MRRSLYLSALSVLIGGLAFLTTRTSGQTPATSAEDAHAALLDTYCSDCHNKTLKTAGVAF